MSVSAREMYMMYARIAVLLRRNCTQNKRFLHIGEQPPCPVDPAHRVEVWSRTYFQVRRQQKDSRAPTAIEQVNDIVAQACMACDEQDRL
jgi:hypothetical protein